MTSRQLAIFQLWHTVSLSDGIIISLCGFWSVSKKNYVQNTTARAFAVVASALGIPALLPVLRAVCRSKKSWQARHTGVRIVQQIPILMGCAILLIEQEGLSLLDRQNEPTFLSAAPNVIKNIGYQREDRELRLFFVDDCVTFASILASSIGVTKSKGV